MNLKNNEKGAAGLFSRRPLGFERIRKQIFKSKKHRWNFRLKKPLYRGNRYKEKAPAKGCFFWRRDQIKIRAYLSEGVFLEALT